MPRRGDLLPTYKASRVSRELANSRDSYESTDELVNCPHGEKKSNKCWSVWRCGLLLMTAGAALVLRASAASGLGAAH